MKTTINCTTGEEEPLKWTFSDGQPGSSDDARVTSRMVNDTITATLEVSDGHCNAMGNITVNPCSECKIHPTIYINGNDDFTSENGVVSGSGTATDPYIIEGWDINASSANGIYIRNTNAYFVIKNCVVHGGSWYYGIHFYNVTNGKIENCTIYNNDDGIYLVYSSNNNISNNQIYNNDWYGIDLWYSSNNNISNNQIYNNNEGISLRYSSNVIYLNNFNNTNNNVDSYRSTNIWNSTSPITYTYKDKTYTNYLGNYWSDYTDVDANNDGIWDNPRNINSDRDYHPLVVPFENYFAPAIFDTGVPLNPYPSISGTFNGTIKPDRTINATKLYTYSCEGTGGHTEYAFIGNKTWHATAMWEGYKGDWHNISFDKPVILLANKTYNYTIRTGSYPQIHHNKTLTVSGGEITCTEFTDANGKVYYDWIPAIRLW